MCEFVTDGREGSTPNFAKSLRVKKSKIRQLFLSTTRRSGRLSRGKEQENNQILIAFYCYDHAESRSRGVIIVVDISSTLRYYGGKAGAASYTGIPDWQATCLLFSVSRFQLHSCHNHGERDSQILEVDHTWHS